jgi:hypothetical protein
MLGALMVPSFDLPSRLKRRRLWVLSTVDARAARRKFVDEQVQPGDLVAILRTAGGVGALQQFTTDRRMATCSRAAPPGHSSSWSEVWSGFPDARRFSSSRKGSTATTCSGACGV